MTNITHLPEHLLLLLRHRSMQPLQISLPIKHPALGSNGPIDPISPPCLSYVKELQGTRICKAIYRQQGEADKVDRVKVTLAIV